MKELKFSKVLAKHLYFYFDPHVFAFPISVLWDRSGVSVFFAWYGFTWYWEEQFDE